MKITPSARADQEAKAASAAAGSVVAIRTDVMVGLLSGFSLVR